MSAQPSILRRIDQTGIPLLIARLVLGVVFVMLGWNKVDDTVAFAKLIRQYDLLPDSAHLLLNATAVCLPWIEIVCGLMLIAGVWIRGSALTLLLLLSFFTFAIIRRAVGIHDVEQIPWCSIKFDCGCGSGVQYVCAKIPENVGLWLLALVSLLSRSRRFCLERDRFATTRTVANDLESSDATPLPSADN